jgi:hypothetical protein
MGSTSLHNPVSHAPAVPEKAIEEWSDRRARAQALRAAQARKTSGRRRLVDPTTTERDYSAAEIEFMQAMQKYKETSGQSFPTCGEILEVLRSLGYAKGKRGAVGARAG